MPPGDNTQQAATIASQASGILSHIGTLGSLINTIGFANVLIAGGMVWVFSFFMGWVPNPLVSSTSFNTHIESQAEQVRFTREMVKQLREIKCDGKTTLRETKDCYKQESIDWK
ncbi:MAG: hypothetical protein Q7R68_11010 [Nitrospirales bacterium]|nr:hypothetical protein [Nitrospirales bacterium]